MAEAKSNRTSTKTSISKNQSKPETNRVVNLCIGDTFDIEEIEGRRLYINDIIDEDTIDSIVYHILRYNRLDKDIPVEHRQPIIIYLNSIGGCVSDGWGTY